MGNQQSPSQDKNSTPTKKIDKIDTNITTTFDIKTNNVPLIFNQYSKDEMDISSYKGIKSDNFSSSNKESKNSARNQSTECQTIPEKLDLKDFKIPTSFEWDDGGNIVYITGSFSNWTQWFIMNKIDKNKFQLNLVN